MARQCHARWNAHPPHGFRFDDDARVRLRFIALADYHTPIANCVLASVFGIGSALVLDEYALVLHLRDVYWAEEGRSSIDAVFVAIAISFLFLLGVHPIGFAGEFDPYEQDRSLATLIGVVVAIVIQLGLAVITLMKGKLWTGLIGLFFTPLLLIGAIRLSRRVRRGRARVTATSRRR